MSSRPYGDNYPWDTLKYDKKQLIKDYDSPLHNDLYSRALDAYLMCVGTYMSDITIPDLLEKQLDRMDINLVCGYELMQMKRLFTQTDILDYNRFLEDKPKF